MDSGQRKFRYAVVTLYKAIESHALTVGTFAQKAKLIALTGTLELSQGKWANIH